MKKLLFTVILLFIGSLVLTVPRDVPNKASPDEILIEVISETQDHEFGTLFAWQEEVPFVYVGNDHPFRTVITPYGMLPLIIELEYPTLDFAYDKHTRESVSESNPMKTNLTGKGTNYDYQKWGLSDRCSFGMYISTNSLKHNLPSTG